MPFSGCSALHGVNPNQKKKKKKKISHPVENISNTNEFYTLLEQCRPGSNMLSIKKQSYSMYCR